MYCRRHLPVKISSLAVVGYFLKLRIQPAGSLGAYSREIRNLTMSQDIFRPCFVLVFYRGFAGVIPPGLGEINSHTQSPRGHRSEGLRLRFPKTRGDRCVTVTGRSDVFSGDCRAKPTQYTQTK
jgi:hypothetical protein